MRNRNLKVYFIIIFCLSSVLFFSPTRININKAYYSYYALFSVVVLLIATGYKRPENSLFSTPILLLLIAAFISGFSATLFWNQSIIDSMKPLVFFMSYILYFLLVSWKFRMEDIEKIIVILAFMYIIIHTLTLLLYPQPIFGNISWADNRGFPRIRIPGTGFLFLLSFYSLGQYFQKRKFLWLFVFFITLIYIILTLTRTYIAISFIFLALYALHKSKNTNKIVAVLFITFVFFIISQMNFSKILTDQTISETNNIENIIRLKTADFYLHDFSPNAFTKIFGNGVAYYDSSYGYYMRYLMTEKGLHQTDIGYIGLYSQYGMLAILAYLIIIFRTVKVSVPEEYLYCKYFLYFIFVIGIIISSAFSTDFIIPILLALYILSSNDLSRSNIEETL